MYSETSIENSKFWQDEFKVAFNADSEHIRLCSKRRSLVIIIYNPKSFMAHTLRSSSRRRDPTTWNLSLMNYFLNNYSFCFIFCAFKTFLRVSFNILYVTELHVYQLISQTTNKILKGLDNFLRIFQSFFIALQFAILEWFWIFNYFDILNS